MRIDKTIANFEDELIGLGTRERAEGTKGYLKSDLDFLGATLPDIRRVVKAWLGAHPDLSRADLASLVRELWRSRLHELHMVAIVLLQNRWELLDGADTELVEGMLRTSWTWAYVDPLSITVAGGMVERDPALVDVLDRWATDEDFWIRRSAMLALLGPLRRGEGDWKRFVRYADAMLDEKEFFIRKAIGWVLREVSKKRPERVLSFLTPRRVSRASGVTMREAVKYVPERDREALMKQYREG